MVSPVRLQRRKIVQVLNIVLCGAIFGISIVADVTAAAENSGEETGRQPFFLYDQKYMLTFFVLNSIFFKPVFPSYPIFLSLEPFPPVYCKKAREVLFVYKILNVNVCFLLCFIFF